MDDQVSGKLAVTASVNEIRIEASDGVPTGLIVQVIDSYSIARRRQSENAAKANSRQKYRDFIQSGFMLAALIMSLGFVVQVSGCGQQANPYEQYQWGAGQ